MYGINGERRRIEVNSDRQKIAALMILHATCETTLQAFRNADNPLDEAFSADLERIIARTQRELDALQKPI
jgi:hypothetical protein